MPYIKVYIHVVWGTKRRFPYLNESNTVRILNHIKENSVRKGIYIDTINGYRDHIHCCISLKSDQTIAKTIQLLKGESSFWINKTKLIRSKFGWADEYYAGSVSYSAINYVRDYIRTQKEHHHVKSWEEECKELMEEWGMERFMG